MERLSRKSVTVFILTLLLFILPTILAVCNEPNGKTASDIIQSHEPTLEENISVESKDFNIDISQHQDPQTQNSNFNQNLQNLKTSWAKTQQLRELYSDRVRLTNTGDGTTTAEFYITPTFYIDSQGTQQFIDTAIVRTEVDNSEFEYQSLKNNLKINFKEDYIPGHENTLISIKDSSNQNQLTWQPLRLSVDSVHENVIADFSDSGTFKTNLLPKQGLATENQMEYHDIYPGCVDSYLVEPNKLRHDFILHEFPRQLLELDADQLTANDVLTSSGSFLNYYGILSLPEEIVPYVSDVLQTKSFETSKPIELRSTDTGETIYRIQEPIAYEQLNPEERIECSYEFIPINAINSGSGNTWSRTLVIQKTTLAWLMAPDREYPVVLDPDLETPKYDKGEEGFDTYLVQGNETEPEWTDHNFGASPDLKVTLAGPSLYSHQHKLHRSILKFPGIDIIKSNAIITSARLIMICKSPGNMSITVFKLYDDWIEGNGTESEPGKNGATWNNSGYNIWSGGNYDGHVTDHATVLVEGPKDYVWNIIDIVRDWTTNPEESPNQGLLLTGTDNEDVIKIFHSSEAPNPDSRPKVEIVFNTPPQHTGLENITVYETQPNIVPTIINRTDIFWDPDVDELHTPDDEVEFEIWNGSRDSLGRLYWVSTGIYHAKDETTEKKELYNFSVELKLDEKIYITPYENCEVYGSGIVKLRVKDRFSSWQYLDFMIYVIATNDKPVIKRIDDNPDFDRDIYYVTEDEPRRLPIKVYDPDNPDFLEKTNPKAGDPGDLDFDWERDKTKRFVISETGDIIFNPDNSLVGNFYINITVYDTEWYKKGKRILKQQLSNYTTMLTFVIENSNDPPDTPVIIAPKENSEYSTEDIITFSGKCTDDDFLVENANEKLTFKWILGEDTPLGQGSQIKTRLAKGTHLITLRVQDLTGESSEVNTTIRVRNRATIDELNCSNYFVDEMDDVLCFYYEITDEGVQTFRAERGSFSKYNIFDTDINEFTSKRVGQYIWLNLTISENITYILESENHVYEFGMYLVKPKHEEVLTDLKGIRYLGNRYNELYHPEDYYARFRLNNKYYKDNNGLGDFKITNKGRTLAIRAHLGDLEAGEGEYSKLQPDFSIFAIVKIEVEQHPIGFFQHIICFDSLGYGGKPAPYPQQITSDGSDDNTNDYGSRLALGIIILIIIISIIGFIILRREAKKAGPEEKIVIDTTKVGAGLPGPGAPIQTKGPLPSPVGGFGMPMQMQMRPHPGSMQGMGPGRFPRTGPMFIPPGMMRPGGGPMMPMQRPPLPPQPGKGKGRIAPIAPAPGKKSTKSKKKK